MTSTNEKKSVCKQIKLTSDAQGTVHALDNEGVPEIINSLSRQMSFIVLINTVAFWWKFKIPQPYD